MNGLDTMEQTAGTSLQDDEATVEEQKCVSKWQKTIKEARDFDDNARKLYARDRKYARGDSGHEVAVNLIGAYIDILVSFIYARDPDVDCMPADSVGESRKATARILAKTCEVVVSKLWLDARMKRKARRWVRSSLTVGIGWLKVAWVENFIGDPAMHDELRSLQQNLAEVAAAERRLEANVESDREQAEYDLQLKITGLEEGIEREIVRGLAIDLVPSEDVQVSLDADNVVDCTTGSWIAHRYFYRPDVAQAKYPRVPIEKFNGACAYMPVKPLDPAKTGKTAGALSLEGEVSATDADSFTKSTGTTVTANAEKGYVCVWEIMDASNNQTLTIAEGVDVYLVEPGPPNVSTERFFNLFPLALTECDGERHPQSLVTRSYKLMDEYNRTRSGLSKQRRRTKLLTLFDARNVTPKDVNAVKNGAINEFKPVKPIGDGTVKDSFFSFPYPRIDMALYDTSPIRSELEALWGIQEALTSSIQVAKTATEAEIQQSGTQARTGAMRDALEQQLTEIAIYTLEIALDKLTITEVQAIAGPEAMWLNTGEEDEVGKASLEHLDAMVGLEIRAGSTGKPNTTQQREAWMAVHPQLVETILKVAALRMSDPIDVSNCLEEVMVETLERTGDRLDIARFMPQIGQPMQLIDPMTGQPVLAYPAPQQPGSPTAPGGPSGATPAQLPPGEQAPGAVVAPAELPEQLREPA